MNPESFQPARLISAMLPETATIIGAMRERFISTPAAVITKTELRVAIGRDPTGLMPTALRHLLQDHGLLVEYDRQAGGWRLMEGGDNLRGREGGVRSLHRKAHREAVKLSVVDFAKLPNPEKLQCATLASQFGAISLFTTASAAKRIERGIEKASLAGLMPSRTAALFCEK